MEPPRDMYGSAPHQRHHQPSPVNLPQPSTSANDWNTPAAPAASTYGASPYANEMYGQQHNTYNPYAKTNYDPYYDQSNYFAQTDANNAGFGGPSLQGLPQQLMSDPVMNAARAYGEQFAEQQKQKFSEYLSISRLKYYFAVDNSYVGKKLAILLFPFLHNDWSVQYVSEEPVPPRYDINAPDLYIPLMAVVTYVVVAGFVLGIQGRFSPEQLGVQTSSALVWLTIENLIVLVSKYILNMSHTLSFWHTVALSSYKFVGMILTLLVYLMAGANAYYIGLVYFAVAITFFLLRSVRSFVLEGPSAYGSNGTKRKLYLLLFISLSQPFVMWMLTRSITNYVAQTKANVMMDKDDFMEGFDEKQF